MREWFSKWEKVIIWVVAVVFVGGIIWWSIAEYIGVSQSAQQSNAAVGTYTPNRDEALAVLTKDGTDLKYDYWVFSNELSTTLQQLMAYYRQMGMDPDELFEEPYVELNAIRSLVDGKVLSYYADQTHITPTKAEIDAGIQQVIEENITTDEIRQAVIARYGSIEAYKELIRAPMRTQMTREKVNALVSQPTEEQYRAYFQDNLSSLQSSGNQVKGAHILVDSETLASSLIERIQSGELTFTAAASDFSLDASNAPNGGDLGWFGKGQMVKEFEDAAFAASPGDLVGPVKTDFGYHIIRIDDKKTLSSFEDFKGQSELWEKAKGTLETENYTKWLADYKAKEKIAYEINDNVLEIFDDYVKETNESESATAVVAFRSKLEPFILIPIDGKVVWAQDVDPRVSALFLKILETENEELQKDVYLFDRAKLLQNSLNPSVAGLGMEEITQRLAELDAQLAETTDGASRTLLLNQKFDLKDVEEYLQKLDEIAAKGLVFSELNEAADKARAKILRNDELRLLGYKELYDYNTSSKAVVEKLHSMVPEDPQVSLRYYQSMLNEFLPYVHNKSIYLQYRVYLEPQMKEIQANLTGLAQDGTAPTDTRVAAYESLLTLMESLENFEEEVVYLKELKTLKPNYPDIDLIIKQVEEALEIARLQAEEALRDAASGKALTGEATGEH